MLPAATQTSFPNLPRPRSMPVLMVPSTSPKLGPHGPLATLPPTWPRSHESVRRSPPILFYYQSIYLYLKIGNKSVVCIFYNKLHLYYQSIHLSCCLYIFKTLSTSLLIRDAWHLQWLKERRHQEEQQWQSTTKKYDLRIWTCHPPQHLQLPNYCKPTSFSRKTSRPDSAPPSHQQCPAPSLFESRLMVVLALVWVMYGMIQLCR